MLLPVQGQRCNCLMNLNSIFDYLDYREFLKDHYEVNKANKPFFHSGTSQQKPDWIRVFMLKFFRSRDTFLSNHCRF
jgi:hypothetical protein